MLRGVRRRSGLQRHRALAGMVLLLPAGLFVGVVILLPIGQAVYYSMTNWNGLTTQWIGPSTYSSLFKSSEFWRVLQNNAVLLLTIPIVIMIALAIAEILHQGIWWSKTLRTLIFLPTVLSWVVIGLVAAQIYAYNGTLNGLLSVVGLGGVRADYLSGQYSALIVIALTYIWAMVGPNMIILLSGMSTIDPVIYEAVKLDGARRPRTFVSITLPLMVPYLQFCFVFTLVMAFTGLFSLIFVMTGGGPGFGTTTLEYYLYREAFNVGNFGEGALVGVVLLVAMLVISFGQIVLTRSRGNASN